MTADDFKKWREAMGFSQAKAALALDVSKPTIENYERGVRRDTGKAVEIPLVVALACAALFHRIGPWESPE